MNSLSKLKFITEKYNESNHFGNDAKVEMISVVIKNWCNEYLRIHENIEETSISQAHKIERKEKLNNEILSI